MANELMSLYLERERHGAPASRRQHELVPRRGSRAPQQADRRHRAEARGFQAAARRRDAGAADDESLAARSHGAGPARQSQMRLSSLEQQRVFLESQLSQVKPNSLASRRTAANACCRRRIGCGSRKSRLTSARAAVRAGSPGHRAPRARSEGAGSRSGLERGRPRLR